MARAPVFSLAERKIRRAQDELRRLEDFLAEYDRLGLQNQWSRTSTIAFAVHGIYNGLEDVMVDLAREIDEFVPRGEASHQALINQMHVELEGRRPALLDVQLHRDLTELKAFRHLVRHQYGLDLIPNKTEAKRQLVATSLASFVVAIARLEEALAEN